VLSDAKFRRIGIAATNQLALTNSAADGQNPHQRAASPCAKARGSRPQPSCPSPLRGDPFDDSGWAPCLCRISTAGIYVDAHDHTLDLELEVVDWKLTVLGIFPDHSPSPAYDPWPGSSADGPILFLKELDTGKMDSQWLQMNALCTRSKFKTDNLTWGCQQRRPFRGGDSALPESAGSQPPGRYGGPPRWCLWDDFNQKRQL